MSVVLEHFNGQGHYSDDWATPVAFSENPAPSNLSGLALLQVPRCTFPFNTFTGGICILLVPQLDRRRRAVQVSTRLDHYIEASDALLRRQVLDHG
jgi:hypothetical protein